MPRVAIDRTIQRRETGPFAFPLGVYPVEPLAPVSGFVSEFEAADSGDTFGFQGEMADDWEEWPDRFMFDVAITATRLRSLARLLFTLLPGRVYPILDVIGTDAYREIDPFIAYELVGIERFYDAIRMYGDWLFEDGLVGFGAMSVDPFIYVFIDEHKLVTIRAQPFGASSRPKKFRITLTSAGGRISTISGSRPTMIVSVWWRAWDQRQDTGLRTMQKLAI